MIIYGICSDGFSAIGEETPPARKREHARKPKAGKLKTAKPDKGGWIVARVVVQFE